MNGVIDDIQDDFARMRAFAALTDGKAFFSEDLIDVRAQQSPVLQKNVFSNLAYLFFCHAFCGLETLAEPLSNVHLNFLVPWLNSSYPSMILLI